MACIQPWTTVHVSEGVRTEWPPRLYTTQAIETWIMDMYSYIHLALNKMHRALEYHFQPYAGLRVHGYRL